MDTILLRGMGLGGWMLQEGYMLQTSGFANAQYQIREKIEQLIGQTDTELFYNAWLANHVQKADIDSMKSWGFNSVRLPMHYNLYTLPIEEEPITGEQTWLTKGFELTDSLISWCAQNEIYVILDLHAAPGGQGEDQAISDYDPSKPSLWESALNRSKTVALWKKLAERYKDETWVAGYDLLNEPNWNLPGNSALRNLYKEITDSIRTVDPDHIIFIEGNWWANDFTGLTPPWDSEMVYSPHKYWSYNDQASIQWVLDMSNTYNIPLYLSESGENSNVWFRDAIRLLEDNNIGWAWWPLKKVASISCPLSIPKTADYQTLLNYWNGNGPTPSAAFAKDALMELTEMLKVENCRYQKDVIDAMFRQVYSNELLPYNTQDIPGVVYASDYDMGVIGAAYFDEQAATYQVSTGEYTSWNDGWGYRNDGVDIEPISDVMNSNGYAVGWIDGGEWMVYDVEVASTGRYNINIRLAAGNSDGKFHLEMDGGAITPVFNVSTTGGWQNWGTFFVYDVILYEGDNKLKFYTDSEGFNLSSLMFTYAGSGNSMACEFMGGVTKNHQTIILSMNKQMVDPGQSLLNEFRVFAGIQEVTVTGVSFNANNPRIIEINTNGNFVSSDEITVSYSGTQIIASDSTQLETFTYEPIRNNLDFAHVIPGKIEAEAFTLQDGVELEVCTDIGGGENVGYLDPGDLLDYDVSVANAGTYKVLYRTAAEYGGGGIQLQLVDSNGSASALHSISFPITGGWQTWQTTEAELSLPAGRHKMRILVTQSPFNLNWFEFIDVTSTPEVEATLATLNVFPNPGSGNFNIHLNLEQAQAARMQLIDIVGNVIYNKPIKRTTSINERISLKSYANGSYFLTIQLSDGSMLRKKLILISD